jgi:uncharacterized protein (DUF2147 family)
MLHRGRVIALAIIAAIMAGSLAIAAEADPKGTWLTQAGDAKVAVSRCGENLCGRIVWLKTPINATTGKPEIDDKNTDPRLATRPVIGIQLFVGMKPTGPHRWTGGIYNADDGKTYDSSIAFDDPSKLNVNGCVGPFCGGEVWTRLR